MRGCTAYRIHRSSRSMSNMWIRFDLPWQTSFFEEFLKLFGGSWIICLNTTVEQNIFLGSSLAQLLSISFRVAFCCFSSLDGCREAHRFYDFDTFKQEFQWNNAMCRQCLFLYVVTLRASLVQFLLVTSNASGTSLFCWIKNQPLLLAFPELSWT